MRHRVEIVHGPLPELELEPPRADAGAEIVFHGRVREVEDGNPIVALYYEHYAGMAEEELERRAERVTAAHGSLDLVCIHRVGEVPAGEASLRVIIRSPHRAEALAALESFVREIKEHVPIWKWSVSADGSRRPT